jgi:hypothetical protein
VRGFLFLVISGYIHHKPVKTMIMMEKTDKDKPKKIFHIKKFLLSLLSNVKIIEDVKGRRIKKKL